MNEPKNIETKTNSEDYSAALEKYRAIKASQANKNTATGRTGAGILIGFIDSKKPYLSITCKDRHEFDHLYDQIRRFRDKRDYDYVTIKGSRKELQFELFLNTLMEKMMT